MKSEEITSYIRDIVRDYIKNMDEFGPVDNPLVDLMETYDRGLIKEGYYKTYPIDNVVKYIKELFNDSILSIAPKQVGNSSYISIEIPSNSNYEELNRAMGLCGYYEATKSDRYYSIIIRYEPRYSDSIDNIIGNQKYLYHASPIIFKDKILKNGLCPHSKNGRFQFPDRVYLFKAYDEENGQNVNPSQLIGFAKQLRSAMVSMDEWQNDYKKIGKDVWLFYRVDVSKLPKGIKFYDDITWAGNPFAIWTYDNIPPQALEIIGKHDFRN